MDGKKREKREKTKETRLPSVARSDLIKGIQTAALPLPKWQRLGSGPFLLARAAVP